MDQLKFEKYRKQALSTVYSEPDTPEFHTPLIKGVVDLFLPLMELSTGSRIIDIGCGQGAFMEYMRQKGFNDLLGVTLSPEDASACEQKGFLSLQCDFSDLYVENNSVDLIWCRHALEHSPYPVFSLMEFNRVVKMGKYVYVEVPAPNLDDRNHEGNANHYSVLGDRMWVNLFQRTGFQIIQYNQSEFSLTNGQKNFKEMFYCFLLHKNQLLSCNQ